MSKRPRATRSTRRQRPRPSPAGTRVTGAAAEIASVNTAAGNPAETAAVEAGKAADAAQAPAQPRAAAVRPQARANGRPSGLLAQKAATEYVYVAQDLRRIGTFAGAAAVVMLVVWFLVDLVHVISV
ncbi:MAG: hypothetical protein ACP5VP_08195 [Candidatus Limnocylindrales bacterium]